MVNKLAVTTKGLGHQRDRVAVYVRVSTDDQHSSVENQQQLFTSLIAKNNWILHQTYTDEGISGTKSYNRKFYKEIVEDGKNNEYDILIAKSYSRFGRNQRETLQALSDLMQAGIRIIFLEDGLDSKKDYGMFGLFGWLAEQEARKTSERLKTVWQHYDEIGKIHVAKPPYGYSYNKKIQNYEVIPEEKEVVLNIYKMYLEGKGCRGIAMHLNNKGIPTQKGVKWSQITIANMLVNRTYTGALVQGKSETVDVTMKKSKKKDESEWKIHTCNHEAIIKPEIFIMVQEEVKKRRENINVNGRLVRHSNAALFSTVIKCKNCGSTCTIKRQKHFRNFAANYVCIEYEQRGKKICGHERVNMFEETLIEILQGEIKKLVDSEYAVIREALEKIKENSTVKNISNRLKSLEEEEKEKGRLSMISLISFNNGNLGEAQFKLQNELIETDLQKLNKEKIKLEGELRNFNVALNKEGEIIEAIQKLASLDVSEWTNAMIKTVINKITIDSNKNVEVYLRYKSYEELPTTPFIIGENETCATLTKDNQNGKSRYLHINRLRGYIKNGPIFRG